MTELSEKVNALAEARRRVIEIADDSIELEMEVRRLFAEEHPDLVERRVAIAAEDTIARDSLAAIESDVRTDTCAWYEETGNENPTAGVSVVISTKYDYDPDTAFSWAKNHLTALTLDKKTFGEVCKSDGLRPDFVAVIQEPTARIATDLKKALEGKTDGDNL